MPELLVFGGDLLQSNDKFAILQKLDQTAGTKGLFLDSKMYIPSIKEWENVPVIFAKNHPKTRAMENLRLALDECGGRLLGFPKNVRLETGGHAKLVGDLPLNDAVAQDFYKAGKLSPSVAFDAEDDGKKLTGVVKPDHILIFPEDARHQPGDKGAMLFQEQFDSLKEFIEYIIQKVKGSHSSGVTQMEEKDFKEFQAKAEEEKKVILAKLKTFEDEKTALQKALDEKTAEVKAFQEKVAQEKRDATWKEFSSKIPKGWLTGKVKVGDKEEDKASITRKEFEADPTSFTLKVLKFNEEHPNQGNEGQGQPDAAPASPDIPAVKTIGIWNEAKQQYE